MSSRPYFHDLGSVVGEIICGTSPMRRVAEICPYRIRLQVTEAVTKGAEWADRGGSTQLSDLVDPTRSYSQAAQASAAAKIKTTAA